MPPNTETVHFLISLLIGLALYLQFRRWWLIPLCFLTGLLIDIDHWFDYFLYFGPRIDFQLFFNVRNYMDPAGKVYILFHGWEYLIVFWLVGRFVERKWQVKGVVWALILPYLGHLLIDNFSCSHHPLAYFLTYRVFIGFDLLKYQGMTRH